MYHSTFNQENGTSLGISHRDNLIEGVGYIDHGRAEKPDRKWQDKLEFSDCRKLLSLKVEGQREGAMIPEP